MITNRPSGVAALARKILGVLIVGAAGSQSACALPLDVEDRPASILIAVSDVQAQALGEHLVIEAQVRDIRNNVLPKADIHWEISHPDVLEPLGNGRFKVVSEGSVKIAVVASRAPSVRAAISVAVNASFLSRACIVRSDQGGINAQRGCAEQQLTVTASHIPASATIAPDGESSGFGPIGFRSPFTPGAAE
jgi:hypothetical protein